MSRNVFSIGRVQYDEDQLTEYLAWLMVTVPSVGDAIVSLALGERAPVSEVVVETQHVIPNGRLDAIVRLDGLVLVIESKICSTYETSQIPRYLDWLASEHGNVPQRVLMTLTAKPDPWKDADRQRAEALRVLPAEKRWEQLHEGLEPLVSDPDVDYVSKGLVREFLDMLTQEEGLIPMKPLDVEELPRWPDAYKTIQRFQEFLRACVGPIGKALGIKPSPSAASFMNPAYVYQEYRADDGRSIAVGLNATDDGQVRVVRHMPILWVQVHHAADWSDTRRHLDELTPDGWRPYQMAGDRKRIWRYLDEVVEGDTFEDQRDSLVAASLVGADWLAQARSRVALGGTAPDR